MFLTMSSAFGISVLVVIVMMPVLISFLHKINYNQTVSEYSLQQYKEKQKTPTMGGILFVLTPILVTCCLVPSAIADLQTVIVMLAFIGYGLIGFIDDYIIVVRHNNEGLKPAVKFLMQSLLAVVFFFMYRQSASTDIVIPFFKSVIPLGGFYILLVFFLFTGSSNAVNLTDGMDGLAAGTSFLAFAPFVLFALQQKKLGIAVFLISVMGSLLGYLKFNLHPAKIFMGDTGSLALGGALAAVSMVLKQEISLVIIGGVFVWETLCVIIQISSVKLRGKRVFKYTPIHYSFVISGMRETRVVMMFWILGLICAALGFLIGVM